MLGVSSVLSYQLNQPRGSNRVTGSKGEGRGPGGNPLVLLCAMLIFQRLWDPAKRVRRGAKEVADHLVFSRSARSAP